MNYSIPFFFAALVTLSSTAQTDCSNGRFSNYLFSNSVDMELGVYFGENTAVSGGIETLELDVYTPTGDTATSRPVVIVGFGGSFVTGSRQDVAWLCQTFAKLGYVAIAPDYRIGFFIPNEYTTLHAVTRGMHDMKACVRFLKKTVAEDGDPYGIDPDRIIIGGISAGAVSAIHATYLDESNEIPEPLWVDSVAIGGVEGNSGSPGYSSAVAACFSLSGAIGDTTYINTGDVPLVSVHSVGDGTVPYGTEEIVVFNVATGLVASGSGDIHARMENIGIPNCLLTYPDSGHVDYLVADLVNTVDVVVQFCKQVVCNEQVGCGMIFSEIEENNPSALNIWPNPVDAELNIEIEKATLIEIIDLNGRLLFSTRIL